MPASGAGGHPIQPQADKSGGGLLLSDEEIARRLQAEINGRRTRKAAVVSSAAPRSPAALPSKPKQKAPQPKKPRPPVATKLLALCNVVARSEQVCVFPACHSHQSAESASDANFPLLAHVIVHWIPF